MEAIDAELDALGSKQGCTRAEVQTAFDYLTSPIVGCAAMAGDGIVILKPLLPP